MSFFHFFLPQDTLGLSSQSIRGSFQDQMSQTNTNNKYDWPAIQVNKSRPKWSVIRVILMFLLKAGEQVEVYKHTEIFLCCVSIIIPSFPNGSGWSFLVDQQGEIFWGNVPNMNNVMRRKKTKSFSVPTHQPDNQSSASEGGLVILLVLWCSDSPKSPLTLGFIPWGSNWCLWECTFNTNC